jgi:GTPase SAR1 family protein
LAPEHLKHEKYIEGNSVTRWHSIEEDDMVLKKSMSYLSNEAMEIERQIASKEIVELISLDSKGLKSLDYYLSTLASKQKIHLINISRNSLTCFPECIQLDNICRINLSRNFLKSANIACDMPSLIELDLSNNDLREFLTADTLRRISNVATLCLHSNKIDHLPGDLVTILAGFGKLTDLNLSYNHIQLLPDEIGQLTCLSSLRLGGNLLSRLPLSITSLNASVKLDISDNKLVYPPQDVAKLGMRYIRGYFEEKENKVKFSQFKLIVVGHESAGKTSTVNCLVDSMQASSIFSGLSAVGETEPRARLSPVVASSEQLLTADVSLFDDVEQPVYSPPRKGACGAAPESTIGLDIKKVSFRLPSMPRDSPNHGMSSPSKISASHSSDYISTGFDPGASNNAAAREGDDLVTLSVWDFAGQEIYHSAHEAFFSNQALYLVVWDMRNHSPRSIDLKVQFWIDLIQVRAPGSSIIVVGTRKDALPPSKVGDILHQLSTQLQRNESNRIDRVAQDIAKLEEELLTHRNKTDSSEVMSKLDNLKSALNLRPKIRHCVSVCTRLSSSEPEAACSPESYDISELVDAIVSVSTISKDVQNPFQLVNVLHPMYYESVRKVISELKNVDYMMDLDDLHRIIQSRAAKGGASSKQSTEAAVAFLASIGEVRC